MPKFYYNTPIYRETLLQFTGKYCMSRMPFHFRCAEANLRCAAQLILACLKKGLHVNLSRARVLESLSTAWHLK